MSPSPLTWFLLFAITLTVSSSFAWSFFHQCSSINSSSGRCSSSSRTPFALPRRESSKETLILSSSTSSSSSDNLSKITPSPPKYSTTTTAADAILQAAANVTLTTSPLLGIKSLGIDYGLARTGIAITVGYSPKPLTILPSQNTTQLCIQILQTVENERVDRIVLGLPYHKNGTESNQTRLTREFAGSLVCEVAKRFGVGGGAPIYLWDERYTSKEAAARARSVDPGINLYKQLDAEAACIILEYYYLDGGLGAEEVKLPEDDEVMEEVERIWVEGRDERERARIIHKQKREDCLNARQLAMDRSKILEEKLAIVNGNGVNSKKSKKKKKKKKKRVASDKKWIIL